MNFSIKHLYVFSLSVLLLNGCSVFNSKQAPAAVYGESLITNPYEEALNTTISSTEEFDMTIQPEFSESVASEKVEIDKPLSPAILALLADADNKTQAGDLESAVATIERALRITPRNALLIYKLASIRLQQEKPRLAEDLAKKAALLSGKNKSLKRKSWLLISEARSRQNNHYGAKEARQKADSFAE